MDNGIELYDFILGPATTVILSLLQDLMIGEDTGPKRHAKPI
ncbi:hypothetical protein Megvenef_01315 [Candidatus Megaera venefica]|uniref:Uncharacterized protein n=1 Tax=Candidatus Megaera venefica TaxID=2055910 RepID=A0ABU5NDU9_9RICK|nr:hypothetical protein [Candidatus Megaera venefica]